MTIPTDTARAGFEREALVHLDTLYRAALRFTGDPSRAEDLVQDTMLRAFRAWRSYQPGTNARAWLLTILRNTFINSYRRAKREPVAMELDAAEALALPEAWRDTDPEGEFFARIVDQKVLDAVDQLAPDFREVLVLSDMEGLPYAEIAAMLDIPVGTVKSRLFRARRQLQRALYDHAVEMGYISPREER
jgi:RNA polymerase sigma-70 factor (ECF subfamily)